MKISAHGEIHSARHIFSHLFAPNFTRSITAFAFLKSIAAISDLIPFIPEKVSVFRADRYPEPGVFILYLPIQSLSEKRGAIFTLAVIMAAATDMVSKCRMFNPKPDGVAPLAGILIESFHLIRKNIVPVIAPFPDIAQHIIKSPFVGFFLSNRTGFYEFAEPCAIFQRAVKSGLTGVLPLSFGGEGKFVSFGQKGTKFLIHLPGEGKSLLPSHIDRRQMDFPLVFVGLVSHHILPLLTGNLTVAQIKVL